MKKGMGHTSVEMIKSLCMPLVYCQGLTRIQEGKVASTTALWTFSLVSSLIPFRPQTVARSLPNATLPFAILAVKSSSTCTALERVLTGLVNLSTTFSFCQSTMIVGSLYNFPCAGWCTTSVLFVLIVRS